MVRPERSPEMSSGIEVALGAWIRERRTATLVNQRELANRAGISRSYLCDIERGRGTKPSVEMLDRIATALGADRNELLRVAGILDPIVLPEESLRERRLVSVFRALGDSHKDAMERFGRFLLAEESHWVQRQLGVDEDGTSPAPVQSGPTLFDLSEL